MTKVKLAEATKEINQQSGVILEEAAHIRRNIDALMQTLRKQEARFQREQEEEQAMTASELAAQRDEARQAAEAAEAQKLLAELNETGVNMFFVKLTKCIKKHSCKLTVVLS